MQDIVAELAPTGMLRAGINLANVLLVTGRNATGEPEGVAPDFARAIANSLGVTLTLVPFAKAGLVADAAATGVCDIALIGAEHARAGTVAFTPAYVEIEASYLVPAGSTLASLADVDRAGIRIAVCAGAAYDLWLARNIVHAELVRAPSIPASFQLFKEERLDALAGLRPGLLANVETLQGARILDGCFCSVQQAVGTADTNKAATAFLSAFVEDAKRSGLVARLIERHRVHGLIVAGAAAGEA